MNALAMFYDLILEKFHLSGVYNAFEDVELSSWEFVDCWGTDTSGDPNEWRAYGEDLDIRVVICDLATNRLDRGPNGMCRLVYEGEMVEMTTFEAARRTVYVINTYGDKDYFVEAHPDSYDKDGPDQTTTTETTTTTTTTVTTTTTAGGVSTGDATMIYLLLAGVGAATVAFLTKKRVRTSA